MLVDQNIQEMLRKEAIQTVQASLDQFLCSIFIAPKKDKGHPPVKNLKKLKKHISNEHFKKKGLLLLKEDLQKGHHMCQIGLKYVFFSALASGISKICKGSMEGSVVPVSMSMLWSGPSTKDIYKTVEDSSRSFEEADGRTDNISQRYFNYGSLN